MNQNLPVDVISVCSADGEIRPLRLRMEDESRQMLRINIDEIMGVKTVEHVGAEAQIFLCRATLWEREMTFELKYSIRRHTWSICRKNS
ncbi:MAG: hypothetical protein ACI4PO_06320 [Faecousia sp.]